MAVSFSEYFVSGLVDSFSETFFVCGEHKFEYFCRTTSELVDLVTSGGVEDGETGVDVPFVGVDSQHDVNLHCFDAFDVVPMFPGVTLLACPGCAHTGGKSDDDISKLEETDLKKAA